MSDSKRAAGSDDLLRDFRSGGLMWPFLVTLAAHVVVILATSVPWLRAALGGGKADLTEEQRLDAAVKEATASLQAIAKEHGVRPQDLGSRFTSGGKPAAAKAGGGEKPGAADKPAPATPEATSQPAAGTAAKTGDWGAAGQPPAGQPPAAEPKPDAPAAPPGPALPEVQDDVDLFK